MLSKGQMLGVCSGNCSCPTLHILRCRHISKGDHSDLEGTVSLLKGELLLNKIASKCFPVREHPRKKANISMLSMCVCVYVRTRMHACVHACMLWACNLNFSAVKLSLLEGYRVTIAADNISKMHLFGGGEFFFAFFPPRRCSSKFNVNQATLLKKEDVFYNVIGHCFKDLAESSKSTLLCHK